MRSKEIKNSAIVLIDGVLYMLLLDGCVGGSGGSNNIDP
jgi:hypothetical protein